MAVTLSSLIVTTKNVSRRGQTFPRRQNAPLLGTTLRSLIPMPCGYNWEFLHHSAPKASDLECRTFREDLGWATKPSLGFRDPGLKRTMEELSHNPNLFCFSHFSKGFIYISIYRYIFKCSWLTQCFRCIATPIFILIQRQWIKLF